MTCYSLCGVPNSTEWSLLIFASSDDYKMWWRYIFIYRDRQCTSNIFIAEKIQNDNNFHTCEGFVEYMTWESLGLYLQDYGIIYCKLSVEKELLRYRVYYYDSVYIDWIRKFYWNMWLYAIVKRYWKCGYKIFIYIKFIDSIYVSTKSLYERLQKQWIYVCLNLYYTL